MTDPFLEWWSKKKPQESVDSHNRASNPSSDKSSQQPVPNTISLDELQNNSSEEKQDITKEIKSRVVGNVQTQSVKTQVKKWKKIWMRWFLIWCVIFTIFFLWLFFLWLIYVVNSPSLLEGMWLSKWDWKNILMVFAILFFGILILSWLIALFLNGYRLATIKVWKWKFLVWTIWWLFLLLFSLVWAFLSISRIMAIQIEEWPKTNNLLDAYMLIESDSYDKLVGDDKYMWRWKLKAKIAPAYVKFSLNRDVFIKTELSKLSIAPNNVTRFELTCGSSQKPLNWWSDMVTSSQDQFFQWECLYLNKWEYQVKLKYFYRSWASWKDNYKEIDIWPIMFDSEIILKIWGKRDISGLDLNDNNTEIQLWTNPSEAQFDATKVFSDLGISEYKIDWFIDWQLKEWVSTNWIMTNIFNNAKLFNVQYMIPDIWTYKYVIKLRVRPSLFADCVLTAKESWVWSNKYFINSSNIDLNMLKSISFELENVTTTEITKLNSKKLPFIESFKEWWVYIIHMKYITNDWEEWVCNTEKISSVSSTYKIEYEIKWKLSSSSRYDDITPKEWQTILIDRIPYVMDLHIKEIIPNESWLFVKVYLNDDEIYNVGKDLYSILLDEQADYTLKIDVESRSWVKTTKEIKIEVKKKPVIANLKITPDSWMEPLDVELNAWLSELLDDEDEIIYYSWDYWDWSDKQINTSYSVVNHKYSFDTKNKTWEFFPKVTIKTKKWYEDSFTWSVVVKKESKKPKITIAPPYSSQVVPMWDNVTFVLTTDWLIKSIKWDFGNWDTQSWEWRQYMEATTIFNEPWKFVVKATVEYDDSPAIDAEPINVKVIDKN